MIKAIRCLWLRRFMSLQASSNVQGLVERAYLYILARSGTSVKDQLLYVPTRSEDIEQLIEDLTIDGEVYYDAMRLFSGDTPARQLEAGHQCGGESDFNH